MALTQEACDKYLFDLREQGTLIVDTTYVKNLAMAAEKTYELPFTEIAIEKLGSAITTNIIALGFMVRLIKVVSEESLAQSLRETVKPAFIDLNIKAMNLGFELADNYGK